MDNPYESPQTECGTGCEPVNSHEPRAGSGCLFGFLSLAVFFSVNELALSDALYLRHHGLVIEGCLVGFAPLSCVAAWWVLNFHTPIGNRLRLAPAIVRHALLWVALILATVSLHFAFHP